MAIKDDLTAEVKSILSDRWEVQDATSVPDPEDLKLNSNHAKDLKTATVLYADLDGSTSMVDGHDWTTSAEVYKSYLRCAAALIRSEGGVVTAYDGDRVMAIFTGGQKNTSAVRCALKINYAMVEIVRPAISSQYPNIKLIPKHVVGVDTSQLRAARIGVHGDNDLVWIGRAANYAAKLTNLSGKATWITKTVFDGMNESVKIASDSSSMWTGHSWTSMNDMKVYSSTYYWKL